MGIMVSEVYEAFPEAGAPRERAKAVAERLTTMQDIARLDAKIGGLEGKIGGLEGKIGGLEAKMWKAGIAIAGVAVLLNQCLEWAAR